MRHALIKYRGRIRAQHAEQRRALLQLLQRLAQRMLVGVPFDVDEEHVVPLAAARRPRLDARHADPVFARAARAAGTARRATACRRPTPAAWCLSLPLGVEQLAADDEEARGVVRRVLDLGGEDLQAVDLRRRLPRRWPRCRLRRARGARLRRCCSPARARRPAGARRATAGTAPATAGASRRARSSPGHACGPSGTDGCAARPRRRSSAARSGTCRACC